MNNNITFEEIEEKLHRLFQSDNTKITVDADSYFYTKIIIDESIVISNYISRIEDDTYFLFIKDIPMKHIKNEKIKILYDRVSKYISERNNKDELRKEIENNNNILRNYLNT